MKIRLRLSVRMLGSIILAAGTVFFISLQIIGQNFKSSASVETRQVNDMLAQKYASYIQTTLNKGFNQVKYYAQFVENSNISDYNNARELFSNTLFEILNKNNNFLAIWDTWELSYTDPEWNLPHGRVLHVFERNNQNQLLNFIDTLDLFEDDYNHFYYHFKSVNEAGVSNIYKPNYKNRVQHNEQIISLLSPIKQNNNFAGLVGIDIAINQLEFIIDSLNQAKNFDVTLFSFNGDMIVHPNKELIGQNIAAADTFLTAHYNLLEKIQSGKNTSFLIKDLQGNDSAYFTIASFTVGNTSTPWALMIQAPLTQINETVNKTLTFVKKIELYGIVIMAIIVLIFALTIVLPLQKTRSILKLLALGNVKGIKRLNANRSDEIGDISQSVNMVIDGLEKVTQFAENIGRGNYNYEFTQLSQNDILGNAVLEMRNSLQKAKQEEKAREEEEKQLEWTSQGINLFNSVLRVDNQNLKDLSYEIVKELTLYLGASMGGIYLLTTNKEELELIAFIGFSKDKYNKIFIGPNDGVVGRCLLEKETIFINDVPKDFNKITSGLGKSIPKAVLTVPLISNLQLVGVLEIESIKDIDPYQIAFVERISETIASTIATVKTNVRTAELLDKAKKQAEELEQQEEEMRQNMEEMQATQEEANKRESELMALIKGFEKMLPFITYDLKGKIISINELYLKIFKGRKAQFIGKQHKADLFMSEAEIQKHNEFWEQLNNGVVQESIEYIKSGKDEYWLKEKFVPVRDRYGIITKILCIGFDITELKKTESLIKQIQEGTFNQREAQEEPKKKDKSTIININTNLNYIDLTYLKMVYKKDPAKIYNILKLYYDTLPGQLQEVEELAKKRTFDKLKSKTNSLKTKMNYLGLKKIYENLREIEKLLAEQKNLSEIPSLLRTISNYWSLAYVELKNLLQIPG